MGTHTPVFARTSAGRLAFHVAPTPSTIDVAEILATIVAGVRRVMSREGLDDDGTVDPPAEDAAPLADWAAVSVQQLVPDAGALRRPCRVGRAPAPRSATPPNACHAQWDAYDLHAAVRLPAGHRDRLERVCRYALRPALAEERLGCTPEGDVAVQLRRPWADGTTALVFTPSAFLARLAVLVPRARA